MTKVDSTQKTGKVYIVGAGPGDPGLLTVRGRELLSMADVIVHDRLVGPGVMGLIEETSTLIDVGKSPGDDELTQDDINDILLKEASKGKNVVRLKGGDPFVFGRGGEEATALSQGEISFEVVSGVTSAIAGPAAAGIPVTNRGDASYFTVVTASEDPSKTNSGIDWQNLAIGRQTIVVLMGSRQIGSISRVLIEGGRSRRTPAAVIQSATLPTQKQVVGTLENIENLASLEGITSPSVFVVGEVARFSHPLASGNSRPLSGKRILVTRSRSRASKFSRMLAELGAEPVEIPVIKSEPPDSFVPLDTAIAEIDKFEWMVFASVNAVEFFFSRLSLINVDARYLYHLKIASIGPATSKALNERGILPDLVPSSANSDSLVEGFEQQGIKDRSVLLPAPEESPDTILKGLSHLGCNVTRITSYKTAMPDSSKSLIDSVFRQGVDMVTFTSSSTVRNFLALTDGTIPPGVNVACIGPVTSSTAEQLGLIPDIVSVQHTIDGLVSSIVDYYNSSH